MPRQRPISSLPPELLAIIASATPEQLRELMSRGLGLGAGPSWGAAPPPTLLPRRTDVVTYRVRVDLDDVRPPIWRRLELRSDLTLDAVHDVLQLAMGWTDSHLHAFRRLGTAAGRGEPALLTAYDLAEGDEGTAEADVHLDEVLAEPGDRLRYSYDFGDGWDHTIKLEAVSERSAEAPAARCLAGRRACPPEDCGGPWGYVDLLELLAAHRAGTPVDEDRAYLVAAYDHVAPEEFSVEEVNTDLANGPRPPLFPDTGPHPELDATGLPEPVVELLDRLPFEVASRVHELALRAFPHGTLGAAPTADDLAELTQEIRWFLDRVGDGGITLTGAGYLPPAVVREAFDALQLDDTWIGAGNREVQTIPVLSFRTALQGLGLLRKNGGRLLLTAAGQKVRNDPPRLAQHLAARLPAGRGEEHQVPGTIALLAVAAGEPACADHVLELVVDVLTALGWVSPTGRLTTGAVLNGTRPTVEVLDRMGTSVYPSRRGANSKQTPVARSFARSSLTTPR